MMMVTATGDASASRRGLPDPEAVAKMMEYKQSLQKAGVLLALDELFPLSSGARISYTNGKAIVTDAPGATSQEVVGAYWILQVRTREEAIEWARRAPMSEHEVIEVRRIREMSGFAEDVQPRPKASNTGTS
jgi:hypothetical protein